VDVPTGLALTLSSGRFHSAPPAEQRAALDILIATQNPLLKADDARRARKSSANPTE